MYKATIIAVVATVASASFLNENVFPVGRFLPESNITVAFNSTLPCGQCVRAGYTACYKGQSTKCCND
jgi:hypothetical protein